MANLDEANNLLAPAHPDDGVQIVNGRYRMPDPDTGKPRLYTRATTIAKTLDDTTNLTLWQCRQVGIGVAKTPSIAAKLLACDSDDRKTLNQLVEEAKQAAGANEARELGTALHGICEKVDLGDLNPDNLPEPYGAHVANYRRALRNGSLTVDPAWVEIILLNKPLGIAGKVDRIYRDHEDRLVIGDLKTGGYMSWLSFAMQLSIYATATHWWDGDTWQPMPDVRQDHALIVHLPAGDTFCVIHPVDIAVGYDAVLMALEVRRTRAKDKPTIVKATTWQPPTFADEPAPVELDQPAAVWRAWLADRVETIRAFPEALRTLADLWPAGIPTLKQSTAHTLDQLPLIEHAVAAVERKHGLPFPAQRPAGLPELRTPQVAA